nr:unnamed protein product [Callosobruchus chinensis]
MAIAAFLVRARATRWRSRTSTTGSTQLLPRTRSWPRSCRHQLIHRCKLRSWPR